MLSLPDYRVRQRDYLLEIARAITQELNLDTLLKRILQLTVDILSGSAGLIALRSEEGEWKVSASHGIPAPLLEHLDPLLTAVPDHEDPARFELPKINEVLQKLGQTGQPGSDDRGGPAADRPQPGHRGDLHLPQLSRQLLPERSGAAAEFRRSGCHGGQQCPACIPRASRKNRRCPPCWIRWRMGF